MNAPFRPLPAALQSATQRLKAAARTACDQTIESLALATVAPTGVHPREGLRLAQHELSRKAAMFGMTFDAALDDRLVREVRQPEVVAGSSLTWDALSLVDDREVEIQVAAERFGLQIAAQCEWELRDLDGYVGPVLAAAGIPRAETDRNPLRPEVIGYASIRAIEAVIDRADVRGVLEAELLRSFATILPTTYSAVIAELRATGVKPAGMSVRLHDRSHGATLGITARDRAGPPSGPGALDAGPAAGAGAGALGAGAVGAGAPLGQAGGVPMGQVGGELMALLRRLTARPRPGGPGGVPGASRFDAGPSGFGDFDGTAPTYEAYGDRDLRLVAPNLILEHRDELLRATGGSFDHMVIDVVGTLFDQILSDPKVPPQVARQIGRLQLPVLRAALGDPTFFSSRKHPVRRFINRLASIATAFEDLVGDEGRAFLERVRELVQGIVEGDFDRADVYERQLSALESFVAQQGRREIAEKGDAASLLESKEAELRVRKRYAQRLRNELQMLEAPDFVRDFVADVWSQVVSRAADTRDDALLRRMREAGRDLFMSVQPKGAPEQRKAFLQRLPRLMQDLNEGMDLIAWPGSAKRTFFSALLPAHAQSLKGEGLSILNYNLLLKRVAALLDAPLPTAAEAASIPASAVTEDDILPQLSPEEAQRIGLVSEAAIDWNGKVDIDLSGEDKALTEVDITIDGLPAPDGIDPTVGQSLADHVQIGFAYQMHLDGEWHKVRLAHVNDARSFFIFTRGKKHKQTISLTRRMLERLCDRQRVRTFENAYLLERATARARKQLAALRPAAATA
jgi:hypothetical protein